MRKILQYALIVVIGLTIVGLLRQRRRPIPNPPSLTFLFENPLVEAFAGSKLLVDRLRSRHAGTERGLRPRGADHPPRQSGRAYRGGYRPRQPARDAREP